LSSTKLSTWSYTSNPSLDIRPLPSAKEFIASLEEEVDEVISILGYNVNCDIYSDESVVKIISAITLSNADVVCLQETHSTWQKFVDNLIGEEVYPHRIWHHFSGPGGIAILSKHRIIEDTVLTNTDDIEGSWFPLWVGKIELPNSKIVQICNVHLRPPLDQLGYQWSLTSPFTTNKFRKKGGQVFV